MTLKFDTGNMYRYQMSEVEMEYPSTRKEAMATGATHYFTGGPCARGHIALRKTKGVCVECMKEDWIIDNERRKALPKSEASRAAGRRYYEKNREVVIARSRVRPTEEKRRARKAYKERNSEKTKVSTNAWKRRAKDASPPWLTVEHKAEITAIYAKARALTAMTGVKHVVDHIVPLRSEEVCGLHVPWNLQILTHEANCAKGNKLVSSPHP